MAVCLWQSNHLTPSDCSSPILEFQLPQEELNTTSLQKYTIFCSQTKQQARPASEETLLLFTTHFVQQGLSHSTMQVYLHVHSLLLACCCRRILQYPDNSSNEPAFKKGSVSRKLPPDNSMSASPSLFQLGNACTQLCQSTPGTTTLRGSGQSALLTSASFVSVSSCHQPITSTLLTPQDLADLSKALASAKRQHRRY